MLAQGILRVYAFVSDYGFGPVRQRILEEVAVGLSHLCEVIDEHTEKLLQVVRRYTEQQG